MSKFQRGFAAIVNDVAGNTRFVMYKTQSDDVAIIDDLEIFIQQYKHLPDLPTAQQIAENGLSLSQINAMLLKKIKELTLYVIELKKNESI